MHVTESAPVNLTQRIAYDLRTRIIGLQLTPGEKLSEMKVAAQYNCSRVPVREAFRTLCMEGYLESVPQIGSFVRHIDRTKLEQIRFVRECLETRVMVDGMKSGTFIPLIDKLQDNLARQRAQYEAKDYTGMHRLDDEFHDTFYIASDKMFVLEYMGVDHPDYARARFISLVYDPQPVLLIQQHQRILDAVREQDENALRAAMQEHLTNIYRVLPGCSAEIRGYFDPMY